MSVVFIILDSFDASNGCVKDADVPAIDVLYRSISVRWSWMEGLSNSPNRLFTIWIRKTIC